jgi:hypothetical protein
MAANFMQRNSGEAKGYLSIAALSHHAQLPYPSLSSWSCLRKPWKGCWIVFLEQMNAIFLTEKEKVDAVSLMFLEAWKDAFSGLPQLQLHNRDH